MYGLKQALRAWYDRLTTCVIEKRLQKKGSGQTLFIKSFKSGITIAQIYVDDIIFGSTVNDKLTEFVEQMKNEFEMSMVGELNYFLGLQVKQSNDGIFISQNKYAKNLVKKFGMDLAKHLKTPIGTNEK